MKTYFSIISASIRPEINESLSIGFILVGKGGINILFSDKKLNFAKQLMSKERYKGLYLSVTEIKKLYVKLKNTNDLWSKQKNIESSFISRDQINYLSNYSNNIILFSASTIINIESSINNFQKLFNKYVDETYQFKDSKKLTKRNYFSEYKRQYNGELKRYYNINKSLTSEEFPNLTIPVTLDYLGKNDNEVFVKEVNLERQPYHIREDLFNLYELKEAIPNSKRFLISKEPDKNKYGLQHNIWKQIYKKSRKWDYIDVTEIEKLLEYASEHNVEPLFEDQELQLGTAND